jgi:glycosyltransferase involved in cell wall biosynthesis
MSREALVAVVVPVRNGADYLAECLESILAQTHASWECTIVDNASGDETPDIARGFAARDSRFRHLRCDELVDAVANHNRAYAAASDDSEFCKVVQADDWLYPDCLRQMVAVAPGQPTVGVVSAYQLWDRRVHLHGLPYETTFASGLDVLRETLRGTYHVTGGPTAHLLRTAFVHERTPFWQDGLRHTDTEAVFWLLSRHDFAFVHQILTFARDQQESRSRWSRALNSIPAEDIVFLLRFGPLVFDDDEYRALLRSRLRTYLSWHVRQAARNPRPTSDFVTFHHEKRRQILAEAHGDTEVVATMAALRLLLARSAISGRRTGSSA